MINIFIRKEGPPGALTLTVTNVLKNITDLSTKFNQ